MSTVPATVPPTVTTPTVVTDPTMFTEPIATTEGAVDIESIKEIMDAFDPASLLPELDAIFGGLATVCRWAVLIGPLVLLALGIAYLVFSPKEANYYFGYRCYFGMGSVKAWQFTQRVAGLILGGLGLVLLVVMFFISGSFAGMEVEAMVWKAATCLIWQAALSLIAILAINGAAMANFDAKGEPRVKK